MAGPPCCARSRLLELGLGIGLGFGFGFGVGFELAFRLGLGLGLRLLDGASGGAGRSVASILRSMRARLSASFWCFDVDASPRWLPQSTSARASENELSCVLACRGCRVLAWAARCFGMGCSFQDGQALWSPPSSSSPSRCWLCVSRTRSALRCCTAEARRRSAVVAALLRGEEEAPDRLSALRSGDGATALPLRWLYRVVRIANV